MAWATHAEADRQRNSPTIPHRVQVSVHFGRNVSKGLPLLCSQIGPKTVRTVEKAMGEKKLEAGWRLV